MHKTGSRIGADETTGVFEFCGKALLAALIGWKVATNDSFLHVSTRDGGKLHAEPCHTDSRREENFRDENQKLLHFFVFPKSFIASSNFEEFYLTMSQEPSTTPF